MFEQNGVRDLTIVGYREFLTQQNFDVVIISKNLTGQVEISDLLYSLRAKNVRVIFLTSEKDIKDIENCFILSIQDLIFILLLHKQL